MLDDSAESVRHIVKYMRGIILVSDQHGRITEYIPETPKSVKKTTTEGKKMVRKASKLTSTPKCDALAAKMPPCVVPIIGLTKADVDAINAKLVRARKIRLIEKNIKTLPCKYFFLSNSFIL